MTASLDNPASPIDNLAIGTIIEVDGTHVVAELDSNISELSRVYGGTVYPIGQFGSIVRIHFGRTIIYGYVSRLRMKADYDREQGLPLDASSTSRVIEADLFGEGQWVNQRHGQSEQWSLVFDRGVSTFPLPQQKIYLTPQRDLGYIFGQGNQGTIRLGEHVGSGGAPAHAKLNELLGKHTAVLGSTGAGKSGTVASILHSLLDHGEESESTPWNPRIVVLDPHNEYGGAFPDRHERLSTDEGTLSLPYWLLDLDETASLIIGKTEFAATSQTNIIKNALLAARQQGASVLGIDPADITVDSPVPYVLGDPTGLDEFGRRDGTRDTEGFVGAINEQRPSGADKKKHEDYNKVLRKLETLVKDSRLRFLMQGWDGESDPFPAVAEQFVGEGAPLRIVDLSGVPNDVAGAASSAIARTLFSIKLWQSSAERQRSPVVLVCEEAHRYVPNRGEAQYGAAQDAIRRLAKEGRKYGIGLMLVSQRPSEVEATVLSQCNSWVVLRITNDADRDHVRAILPDSLSGLTKVLPGLRQREAIFVGQATMLPSRIRIDHLSEAKRPQSHDIDFFQGWQQDPITREELQQIGERWRLQQRPVS